MSTPASDFRGSDSREIFSLNDEPETTQVEWGSLITDGETYEPTYEDAHFQTEQQQLEQSQAIARQSSEEARTAAVSTERVSNHERDVYNVREIANVGAHLRYNRDWELAAA